MSNYTRLEDAGFCYYNKMTQQTKCVYPKKVLLDELHDHMKSVSSIIRSFDIGAALELDFLMTARLYGLTAKCMTNDTFLHPFIYDTWIQPNHGSVVGGISDSAASSKVMGRLVAIVGRHSHC